MLGNVQRCAIVDLSSILMVTLVDMYNTANRYHGYKEMFNINSHPDNDIAEGDIVAEVLLSVL
ncbi:MAG: hypothetical protein KBC22_02535 [Candidatus Pacebacteria bacterium]|nr:hypothetical protein [Candidatus Paceibacterota bacterium]